MMAVQLAKESKKVRTGRTVRDSFFSFNLDEPIGAANSLFMVPLLGSA
jgi:hypothetical protein